MSDVQIELVDATVKEQPSLNVRNLALTLENVASRRRYMRGAPGVLTFRAIVEKTGETVGFATFDPLDEKPLAAGHAALRQLRLSNLNHYLAPAFDLKLTEGSFSCFVAFRLRGREITGGIKPVVKRLEAEPAPSASWLKALGIEAADTAADLLSDRLPERQAMATVIPIKGTINQPRVQIIPSILGIMRNAFVIGLAADFSHLPPQTADKPQSIFTQAVQALLQGAPPQAQPRSER
jgi:hypothetical protein